MRWLLFLLALPLAAQVHIEACGPTDSGYSGGTCYTSPIVLPAGAPAYLQRERYGNFSYHFALPDGQYTVTLHMIENSTAITGPSQRVFSVSVNAVPAISNLDLAAVAPLNTPIDRTISTAASGNGITIAFTTIIRNAVVSAIDIAPASGTNTCAHLVQSSPFGNPLVFRNGVLQRPSLDYLISGTTITPRYFADGDLYTAWWIWREDWQCIGTAAPVGQILLRLDAATTPGLQHASTPTGREYYLVDWPPK